MQRYEVLWGFLIVLIMTLSACGGSDDSSSNADPANNAGHSDVINTGESGANNAADPTPEVEIAENVLTLTGQIRVSRDDGTQTETVLNEQLPVIVNYVYESGAANDDPWFTVRIEPENEWLENSLRFSEFELLFHPNTVGIGTHNLGDVSSDFLSVDYNLNAVSPRQIDFKPLDREALTGTITLVAVGDSFGGSVDIAVTLKDDTNDQPAGNARITIELSDIPLSNPDTLAAEEAGS